MRRSRTLIISATVLLSACKGESSPQGDWPEGIFGNVQLSEESGDLGGFEARFYRDNDHRMVEFVLCEGWCSQSYQSEVRRESDGFVFEHVEELIGPEGIEPHQVRYKVTPAGRGLKLESWYDGKKLPWDGSVPLPQLNKTYGLDVAKKSTKE